MYTRDLVSIIMPSYNTSKYIRESIDSVIAQSYSMWELIIVDDCSTDETTDIVTSYRDERIRYMQNDSNSGAAASRNRALREARGEWIAFLDSDDIWTVDKLEKQILFMKKNGYAFSCAYSLYIDEKSQSLHRIDMSPKHISRLGLFLYNWIGCLTVMYHYPTVGLIQVANISKRNDYAMWLRISERADCYCLDEVLGKYRVRKNSVSHTKLWTLVKAHYYLYRESEKMSTWMSIFLTMVNLVMGVFRKILYIKNVTYSG